MPNTSTMPLPRIDKTIPIYSPPDESIVIRLSKDFDDIIEKIEGLGLTRDRKVGNFSGSLVNRFDQKTRDSTDCRSNLRDDDILRCHNTDNNDTDHNKGNSSNSKKKREDWHDNNDSHDCTNVGQEQEQEQEQDQLVERGPIKSHFPWTTCQPHRWMTYGRPQDVKTNEKCIFDYDKTAEQILRDKECSEKLNACLDQLQDAARTVYNASTNSKDQNASKSWNLDNDIAFAPTTIANEPSEDSLLKILARGAVQPAQPVSESRLCSPETARTWQDSRVVDGRDPAGATAAIAATAASESESRVSSPPPNSSPCLTTRAESLQTIRFNNFTCSPIGSPRVAATKHRPLQTTSSSSNSLFSFSSSSNQSCGDSLSPNPMYQVPLGSQVGEQLGDDFENFSLWCNTHHKSSQNAQNAGLHIYEIAEENKADRDADTASNIFDIIDKNDLQLVEEILEALVEEKLETETVSSKSERTANIGSYVNEFTCQESSLRANVSAEQYLTRSDVVNSAIRRNRDNIPVGNVAATDLSESSVSYQSRENGIGSRIPNIETAVNPVPTDYVADATDAVVPTYYNDDVSCGVVEENDWQEQPKAVGMDSDTRRSTVHFYSTLRAAGFPLSSVNDTVLTSEINLGESRPTESTNPTNPTDHFEIPNVLMAQFCPGSSCSEQRLSTTNSDRSIMPWSLLKLPPVRASERLKDGLNPKEVERAMSDLLKQSVEKLAKQYEDGDTMLMRLVGNPNELAKKEAYLAPLVERLSTVKTALAVSNDRGEDALYLAAINCPQYPYVTGYLAATMLQKGLDISQRLYHTRGDTLIHSVAAQGDSHGQVLAELLALKTVQGNAVFDLSKCNYDGRTALHVAIESHNPLMRGIASVATVELLLKHGADPRIKETKCGDTALHMAVSLGCDLALVKVLLTTYASDLVNATNYKNNTPLHLAAAVSSSVPFERQREVCSLLMQAGGHTYLLNRQGKTPLALVSLERKDTIRRIFHKRS